ncbi:MAG: ATP-binding cassette domain-containing protein [Betaproteobacteria bacterium]|nr:ATP-binding cassette domain-containing protein [Betaproteobacteria bacterium]NBT74533.1 ATP-binding cassette domain-containing protein [Betaproteobacteria bacterium]NBY13514.1 ATP-binding cassette domain-containing protein [Betaproteobacteria bacterium]NCA16527.1 ATP-binding cassette domain-containing protein [Betaproteobacteria bacterium]
MATPVLEVAPLNKQFVLHAQGERQIRVLDGLQFALHPGECLSLQSPSGSGKSTVLRCITGNYLPGPGSHIWLAAGASRVDLAQASPEGILGARRQHIAHVSQFLHVIPRVSCLRLVMTPLLAEGLDESRATRVAGELLEALHLPERLWPLAPRTFSGGEQQRVNIAVALAASQVRPRPLVLLDEPTASLDAKNRSAVVALLKALQAQGSALLGAFHDEDTHLALSTRTLTLEEHIDS